MQWVGRLAWSCFFEHLLNLDGELNDVSWRSGPDDEAIAFILEARLDGWVCDSQEILVNYELFELGREKLFLLLGVALYTMRLIQRLNLGL